MKHLIFYSLFSLAAISAFSQNKFAGNEISINAFRSPSIGLEYRYHHLSIHAGYYLTAFKAGETTNFFKSGFTYWFLPVDKKDIPSSFFAGASFMRGLNRNYKNKNAAGVEAGFRWMVWKGINLRIGAIAVAAEGEKTHFNPAIGVSYSFKF